MPVDPQRLLALQLAETVESTYPLSVELNYSDALVELARRNRLEPFFFRRLADWLAKNHPPQVLCLSNAR